MPTVANINNRRYLGNKYKLLPFIKEVVSAHCRDINIVADLFCGTGAVASAFMDRKLITNDILYSNYIVNYAWFGPEKYDMAKVSRILESLNNCRGEEGYFTQNFADTYFSSENCLLIDEIREKTAALRALGEINHREEALLLTSLLYAMDRVAATCGHYDAFRRGAWANTPRLRLLRPDAPVENNPGNKCYNSDINLIAPEICADLVYLDPPYNSRQYCDAYHLLENVARWEKPLVKGVARKMDRTELKSDFSTSKATQAMTTLIESLSCRYILLSYNNMGEKGNGRSNAKISDHALMEILSRKGTVRLFSFPYRAFAAGKSDITDNQERLFLCTIPQ